VQSVSGVIGSRVAFAVVALTGVLMLAGCGVSSPTGTMTATPSFSPAGGGFNSSQAVTITDTTSGAVLYCTTDGTTPTTSSPQCAQPTTVFKSEFLQAIAVAPGKAPSAVASAGYTIDLAAAATPTLSPAGGTYTSTQTVTIADTTAGANIFYTTDGSIPTASSNLYTAPIAIAKSETISAIAIGSGFNNSGVASATYTISPYAATPVFAPGSGTFSTAQTVTISDATAGAAVYYTLDGTPPTATAGTLYTAPVVISSTTVLNAIAVATGFTNSATASALYTINISAAAPTFSVAAGTYTSTQTVIIADTTQGTAIYYTTDGSAPATSVTGSTLLYSEPITVLQSETIKAIATGPGYSSSSVASAAYVINLAEAVTPSFSLAAGSYIGTQTVTISDATTGASIFYTVDGSAPATSATGSTMAYSGAITVSASETINAIATANGLGNSAVATAAYVLTLSTASLAGKVLSGTLPVSGATVQLYAAGQTGYGSAATVLLNTPAITDTTGAFNFSYSCAASPGDLVYLIASGGDTGAGSNTELKLMTALGPCGGLSGTTPVMVNEVTTVASAYALSAFITAAPNVGSSAANYQGLKNAFASVSNLVNLATGNALTITPAYAVSPVAYLNSSTVPQARIDTLANLLNGCVNSNGATCVNLFSAAAPPSGSTPSDSLQAMIDIAQNPGNSVSSLFGLASPTGPFQPVLSGSPGDWTLALTFTGAGLGIPPTAVTSTGEGPMSNTAMAIDAAGDVWVAATRTVAGGSAIGPLVAKFSNTGAPLTPATSLSSASPSVATIGGYDPSNTTPALYPGAETFGILIDQAGSPWLAVQTPSTQLVKIDPALSTAPLGIVVNGNGVSLNDDVIDSTGNVWAGGQNLNEVDTTGSPLLTGATGQPPNGTGPTYTNLNHLTFDSNLNLWATDALASGNADLYQISPTTGDIVYDAFPGGVAQTNGTINFSPTSLVADGNGNIYGCADATGTNLNVFNNAALTQTYPVNAGRGCGNQLVLDGVGHIFIVTNNYIYQQNAAIDEYSASGTLISPAGGYTGTSTGEPATISFSNVNAVSANSAAIDGSGNLWVLNNGTNGISGYDVNFNPLPDDGNVLVEYIGIAAPVVTPTAAALQNQTLGARP